jgi:hypothetical protein
MGSEVGCWPHPASHKRPHLAGRHWQVPIATLHHGKTDSCFDFITKHIDCATIGVLPGQRVDHIIILLAPKQQLSRLVYRIDEIFRRYCGSINYQPGEAQSSLAE